ncbi:hypothetical protein CTI12_AA080270 [Artemisia annua]|uniref:DUF1421 domain-containing protein n=1 Tax=Artemisia annua TaxID=35608 RepID=A0A2U1Q381_ARTAN|nr:hypothetical protein CTI12_AA080270 [Artemisia annua]
MEHYKSRNNDFYHFTNPHDNFSDLLDSDDQYDYYDHQSQSYDDDNCSCDFNFHTPPISINQSSPTANSQISGVMKETVSTFVEELGTFDKGAFIFQLENTMKNISDRLKHRIEGIGTRISRLDEETCKLDKCVEDVKSSEERYHGTTHRKLKQMQTVLQEVQDGVLFLRDKNEIASAQLQLTRIQASKRDKTTAAQKTPQQQQPLPAPQSSSHVLATPQPVSYHPAVSQASGITLQQYIIPPIQQSQTPHQYKPDAQFPHFTQPHQWNTSQGLVSPQNFPFSSHPPQNAPNVPSYSYSSNVQYIPSEPAIWGSCQDHEFGLPQPTHVQPSRNYKSEFHAKYMPEVASFSDVHSHGKLTSSYETTNVKEPSRSKHTHIPVSQDLPYALPTAIVLEDGSGSEGNENTVSVDDIVDDVTAMGFRRDLVRACVRKLTANGSPVDLNAVLDSMMKNK